MKISILGNGAWGTAVGKLAESNGHTVTLFRHDEASWMGSDPDAVCMALPVKFIRQTLPTFPDPKRPVLCLSKGMEIGTGERVSTMVGEIWPESPVGVLSGPTLAVEIAAGLPAAAVVAAPNDDLGQQYQDMLNSSRFRLYRSTDMAGVELGGALKNVYAIAGGVCQQLKLGENCFSALLTRCLAEMRRIGTCLGGKEQTFAGLSGIGDLMLTAGSHESRNNSLGRLIGQGVPLAEAETQLSGVAEGAYTAKSIHLNEAIPADAKPIATQVYRILYDGVDPMTAVKALMERPVSAEG